MGYDLATGATVNEISGAEQTPHMLGVKESTPPLIHLPGSGQFSVQVFNGSGGLDPTGARLCRHRQQPAARCAAHQPGGRRI
ncbi:MAG: hypothetical protein KJZ93_28830 [Caldilineaceae bacterium]|nr:hypothetical protein [Caldilineaceae bacterium]